jgi:hypothetical protein
MGASTMGAIVGGLLDSASGDDDSSIDGMIKGAVIGTALRIAVPFAITYATGWLVWKGIDALGERAFGMGAEE